MKNKSWLIALFLAVSGTAAAANTDWAAVLKNASPNRQMSVAECTAAAGGACVVDITVGDDCRVTTNPDVLKVIPKVFIFWRINPEVWSFVPEKGIVFKKAGPFTGSQRLSDQVWRVSVKDVPPTFTFYPYAINIRSKDGRTCSIDPAIWV